MGYWMAIVAVFDAAPPMLTTSAIALPLGAVDGIWKFTWFRPTKPGAGPEKETVAGTPAIVTVGRVEDAAPRPVP